MLIAGFDCGIKNLGVCFVFIDEKKILEFSKTKKEIEELRKDLTRNVSRILFLLEKISKILPEIFVIRRLNTAELADSRAKEETVACALLEHLNKLDDELPRPDMVYVERQMSINTKTNSLGAQILYHYFARGSSARLVGAGLKNAIYFSPDGMYGEFISKHSNYEANKKHAVFNMKTFLGETNQIQTMKIKKGRKADDSADAFMMVMAKLMEPWIRN
jgi:hypothetical protein